MKRLTSFFAAALVTTAFAAPAFAASPDIYVVNFRNAQDNNSARLDGELSTALAIAGVNAEEVVIDTSTAAKWEKGAHEAFDRDIVPVFNQWVGLPGLMPNSSQCGPCWPLIVTYTLMRESSKPYGFELFLFIAHCFVIAHFISGSRKAVRDLFMKKYTRIAFASLALTLGLGSVTQAYQIAPPDVYVVMFRADYCAPCKVVEPALNEALSNLADPRIEYVHIDVGAGNGERNAHTVFDRGIVPQYNMWLGVTGFAAIIDGDTKQTLGCVNMTYDAGSMAMHIRNLQGAAQQNQATFDLTCPAANRPL